MWASPCLRDDARLREGLEAWFSSEAVRPVEVDPREWLAFEQRKHTQCGCQRGRLGQGAVATAAGGSKEIA